MKRNTILVGLFNPIDVDGRVKRACDALAREHDVTLLCLQGQGLYTSDRYAIVRTNPTRRYGRIWRVLSFWVTFIRMARRMRPDIVYAHDFYLPFGGWLAARLSGARYVYDAHELIVPTNGHFVSRAEGWFYRLERLIARRIDLIIAANPERAEVMREHYRLRATPVHVRNTPPTPVGGFADADVLSRYPGLRRADAGDVHVVYMGDMLLARGLGVLVDSLPFLPAHFKLVFVGNGPDLEEMRRRAAARTDDRLRVIGPVPHAEVFDVVRQGDIGYVSYSMLTMNELLCAPNKVIEYAQAGLPMVSTCQPTIRNIFAAHPMGRLVGCGEPVSPKEVAEALVAVAAERERYAPEFGRFLQANTWEMEVERLLGAVRRLSA